MQLARISGLLTLAAVSAAGSMIAMKTEARAAEAAAIPPVMSCEALTNLDLTPLDARITAAATVTRNRHPFCNMKGYISPATQFEALLPTETWRGDYLQQGCGGLCGKADVSLDDPSRTSGYQAPYAPLSDGEMVVAADERRTRDREQRRRAVGAPRPPLASGVRVRFRASARANNEGCDPRLL